MFAARGCAGVLDPFNVLGHVARYGNRAARRAVGLSVAQCTHDFRYRALARAHGDGAATSLTPEVFRWLIGEEGRLTVTIEAEERELRYQGVVPLTGHSLAACLETYFASSEQLPTRVRLAADAHSAAGLLVQRLPGAGGSASMRSPKKPGGAIPTIVTGCPWMWKVESITLASPP